jgi:hypothetical protein
MFLITSTNSYRFAERIFPVEGDASRTEEVAVKNRSDSTKQAATIDNKLGCYRLTNERNVVSDAASVFRTAV